MRAGERGKDWSEDVVAFNLGGFDYALTALFPDGSHVRIPYGEIAGAIRTLLLGLWNEDYVVLVENPIVVAAEIDGTGKEIGPTIRERLLIAQLIRELVRESGIKYTEVEGSPEKYTTCAVCGEEVVPAERFITYTETGEDYEEFLKLKDGLLRDYADVLAFTRGLTELPELVFFPVAVMLTDKKELKRLKKCIKSLKIAAGLARPICRAIPLNVRMAVVCWLYSAQDVLNDDKMDELASTVEALVFGSEELEELRKKHSLDNIITLYSSSGKIHHLPEPEHHGFGQGKRFALLEGKERRGGVVDLRLMFLPVVLDVLHARSVSVEEFYETIAGVPDDVLAEIGQMIQRIYRLEHPPTVFPPVPEGEIEKFVYEFFDGLERDLQEFFDQP